MRFLGKDALAVALLAWVSFLGCSKKDTEAPLASAEQAVTPTNAPVPQQAASPAQAATVQQVNANWDAVSRDIANQNYDNAVRAWVAMDQAQRQAQVNEAVRKEYARRAYQAQEALREKAQTDAKAREAYQALGRIITGR